METLSSSIPTLKLPTHHQSTASSRELARLKPNRNASHNLLFAKPSSSISDKHPNTRQTLFLSSSSSSLSPSLGCTVHRNPATGYAVALLDKAQLRNAVDLVGGHVERLLGLLKSEKEKGRLVNALTLKSLGFDRDLARLVGMLAAKNRVGIVREVLEEFGRIYGEMSGTRHVSVSERLKIRNVVWG